MRTNVKFAGISLLTAMSLLVLTERSGWEILSLSLTVYTFLVFLYEIGRSIAVRELMSFTACLQMIFAPTLELIQNPDALAIQADDYFSYAFPATFLFCIGLTTPYLKTWQHPDLLAAAREYLIGKERTSLILLILGIAGLLIFQFAPISVKAISYLFGVCLYASVMYSHYTVGKFRYAILSIALGSLLYVTFHDGMFGHMIFWVTLYMLVVLVRKNKPVSFSTKIGLVAIGIFFMILAQSVKTEYRVKTWGDNKDNRKADPTFMFNLMSSRLLDATILFSGDHMAGIYHRLNQGYLVSEVMAYVPSHEPFANGEIITHFLYPFIPRLVWSDKPITGGDANIYRFTPFIPNGVSSSNISPLGEGYVNFGRTGGIIFQFLLGSLFNLVFLFIIKLGKKNPTILLWIPCLFDGCLTFETDVLSTWGSLVIMSVFLTFFWQLAKRFHLSI